MVKLEEHKHQTENKHIERLKIPQKVYIPLVQHLGKPCEPLVKVGDMVLVGQKIAEAQAHVSAPIHASISGKISAIRVCPHPVLGSYKAIVIESDGTDKVIESTTRNRIDAEKLTPDQIREIVREAGIVGMGGAGFPTHVKLNPPKQVDALILNAAECEPYLTCDYRLMFEKTGEILVGLELIKKCLGAKRAYIAIEDNKPEAINKFRMLGSKFSIEVLKSQYPQGGEKQLIKNVLDKEVPSGKLPLDVGVVVQNVATAFAIYEAICKGKSLYERVITVVGDCIEIPENLLVRIGTPIKDLIDSSAVQVDSLERVIMGGPMMGIAQYTDQVPVTKTTSGLLLFEKIQEQACLEEPCIRCGECVRNCPMNLQPCMISLAVEKRAWDLTKDYSVTDCMECGLCSYVCPAKRSLVQSMKYAKLNVSIR